MTAFSVLLYNEITSGQSFWQQFLNSETCIVGGMVAISLVGIITMKKNWVMKSTTTCIYCYILLIKCIMLCKYVSYTLHIIPITPVLFVWCFKVHTYISIHHIVWTLIDAYIAVLVAVQYGRCLSFTRSYYVYSMCSIWFTLMCIQVMFILCDTHVYNY